MGKVNLFFETFRDAEIDNYTIVRLKCGVQFKTKMGWSQPYSAIIDTGAHTSVIPLSLWKELVHEKIQKYKIFGISKQEGCSILGNMGKVTLIVVDENGNQTKELEICAFLAETDQIPLIIGFNGLLEKLKVNFDFRKNEASVED